ncbi:hypothetical protein [Streptosporangium carneum]|uniref:Uncharacterized protein n=1 Tax=Streptosporangium carneum TaxID=47481 RepID=A0A9W6I7M1_9ACTN|nr:hypothetical protein [Streptosporangium carneum]GLK13575.1 hypothetical protein GCM10017600_69860 [Streptosporangium carneum]
MKPSKRLALALLAAALGSVALGAVSATFLPAAASAASAAFPLEPPSGQAGDSRPRTGQGISWTSHLKLADAGGSRAKGAY